MFCLVIVSLSGLAVMSCGEPASGQVGTTMTFGFGSDTDAWLCDDFFDGEHNYTMTVTVDAITDPNTGATTLWDISTQNVTNKPNQSFNLNIPETGGFAITVVLTTNSCVSCCRSMCPFSPWEEEGRATLRDFRTFMNDPGGQIFMNLDLQFCNCC